MVLKVYNTLNRKKEEFKPIKKTKNIGQCSVFYKSRTYEDGKKCTWDVGIHAFKRIIFDRF